MSQDEARVSNRAVYTFFQPVDGLNSADEKKLILLWKANWASAGWQPQVLNELDAVNHPLYSEYSEMVKKFPSINPGRYDYYCYMRWLAVAQSCEEPDTEVAMCDYDVFNYGFLSESHTPGKMSLYQGFVPSLVMGDRTSFVNMCHRFMESRPEEWEEINGRPHTSDMFMLRDIVKASPDAFRRFRKVYNVHEPGWESATAVHYCNSVMNPAGLIPRFRHVVKW